MLPSSFGIDTTPYLLAPWESGMPNATLKSVKKRCGSDTPYTFKIEVQF